MPATNVYDVVVVLVLIVLSSLVPVCSCHYDRVFDVVVIPPVTVISVSCCLLVGMP